MNLTEADIKSLIDALARKIASDAELKANLEKALDNLLDIPPLFDDVLEKKGRDLV
jgi:hypothetical protein